MPLSRKTVWRKEEPICFFVLGGNGTHAGAVAIHNECRKRRMKVSVVAVEEAQRAINSAYIEAHSAYRGVGLVKLMGRSSGFIAMHASLASGQVDICLIPEVPFHIHGPHGILRHLEYLLDTKGSAVICVAEGAALNLLEKSNATDASGNAVFGDIGVHIQQEIKKYFKELGTSADVKYIDPTYMLRCNPCKCLRWNPLHYFRPKCSSRSICWLQWNHSGFV
uniref:Phosphofructokinase domain-containing protein n=1 Tax=Chenopodium quinoa TaxID=63459 RepID=A0A803NDD4_CHEQI